MRADLWAVAEWHPPPSSSQHIQDCLQHSMRPDGTSTTGTKDQGITPMQSSNSRFGRDASCSIAAGQAITVVGSPFGSLQHKALAACVRHGHISNIIHRQQLQLSKAGGRHDASHAEDKDVCLLLLDIAALPGGLQTTRSLRSCYLHAAPGVCTTAADLQSALSGWSCAVLDTMKVYAWYAAVYLSLLSSQYAHCRSASTAYAEHSPQNTVCRRDCLGIQQTAPTFVVMCRHGRRNGVLRPHRHANCSHDGPSKTLRPRR